MKLIVYKRMKLCKKWRDPLKLNLLSRDSARHVNCTACDYNATSRQNLLKILFNFQLNSLSQFTIGDAWKQN